MNHRMLQLNGGKLMYRMECPKCGHRLKFDAEHVGKKARCQKCKRQFRVAIPEEVDELLTAATEEVTSTALRTAVETLDSQTRKGTRTLSDEETLRSQLRVHMTHKLSSHRHGILANLCELAKNSSVAPLIAEEIGISVQVDPHPAVRIGAVQSLALPQFSELPSIRSAVIDQIARVAANDSHPAVRLEAWNALDEIDRRRGSGFPLRRIAPSLIRACFVESSSGLQREALRILQPHLHHVPWSTLLPELIHDLTSATVGDLAWEFVKAINGGVWEQFVIGVIESQFARSDWMSVNDAGTKQLANALAETINISTDSVLAGLVRAVTDPTTGDAAWQFLTTIGESEETIGGRLWSNVVGRVIEFQFARADWRMASDVEKKRLTDALSVWAAAGGERLFKAVRQASRFVEAVIGDWKVFAIAGRWKCTDALNHLARAAPSAIQAPVVQRIIQKIYADDRNFGSGIDSARDGAVAAFVDCVGVAFPRLRISRMTIKVPVPVLEVGSEPSRERPRMFRCDSRAIGYQAKIQLRCACDRIIFSKPVEREFGDGKRQQWKCNSCRAEVRLEVTSDAKARTVSVGAGYSTSESSYSDDGGGASAYWGEREHWVESSDVSVTAFYRSERYHHVTDDT